MTARRIRPIRDDWRQYGAAEIAAMRRDRAVWLGEQIDALPGWESLSTETGRADYQAARAALLALIEGLPDSPVFLNTTTGTTIRMLGATSTSTTGAVGALRNWMARVRKEPTP